MKPENILLDYLGHVQLADFGLSKKESRVVKKVDVHFVETPNIWRQRFWREKVTGLLLIGGL